MRRRAHWYVKSAGLAAAIALLCAIALPAWTDYIRLARRNEAMGTLQEMQQRQARWRANNPSFSDTLLPGPGASTHYRFTIPTATATRYVLRAVASGDQTGDTGCTTLEIEFNAGALTRHPNPDTPNCWRRN